LPPGGGRPPSKVEQSEGAVVEGGKGISQAEYNRWLVAEENWNVAEDGRQTLNQIRDFRRAVRQEHLERGRERTEKSRQQRDLALQKVASFRESKRSKGNEVKAQIGNWNEQVSMQRRAWSDYGNALKTGLTAERKNTRRAHEQERAELAKQLRIEREMQETLREETMQRIEEHNRQQAVRIKAETATSVTDESKRVFFSQRKAIANEVLKMEERWKQERAASKDAHAALASEGVAAAKATRGGGREAKRVLVGERGAAAKELRDKRTSLREQKAEEEKKNPEVHARAAPSITSYEIRNARDERADARPHAVQAAQLGAAGQPRRGVTVEAVRWRRGHAGPT